ncbi:MAG: PTS sugar transporter subunit IIC [Gemmatimonadota bacterium]
MAWRIVVMGLLGALCYLDRTAAFQLMFHRPLVVASLAGAVFGDFAAGAQVGAVLELLYIARLPVGASIPPDDTGAALFGGAAAATGASSIGLDPGSFCAILLFSVASAEIGKFADRSVRRINGRIAHLVLESVDRGDAVAVENGLLAGLTLFAVSGMVLAALFSGLGAATSRHVLPLFGPGSRQQFAALLPALPLLGAASVFSCSRTERTSPAFYLTMAGVFAATVVFHWIA